MSRPRLLASSVLALLVWAAPARAADPVLPLAEVRAGMQCTSLSVIRGVEPVPFDVEIIDVVEGGATGSGPRILIRVSGPAVDPTGIGPGFSGSPIYCPNAQGVPATAGAISEAIGEYGGKVVLATPIEAILGNPPDAPAQTRTRPATLRRARRLAEPLSITGLSRPLGAALTRAAARHGRIIVAAPAGPLAGFPPQTLRPGSAMGVGYASGDLGLSAVGTVAYVDGDRVWSFGHELDAVGRRNLLLQDAYVYRVINNPNASSEASTYKLAATSHTLGTLSNDALSSVVGRTGVLPRTVPVRVTVRDQDTGARESVDTDVADETDVGNPLGPPLIALIAPLAVTQGAAGILRASPGKVTGDMCAEIAVRELPRRRLRFCNRYVGDGSTFDSEAGVSNVVASSAGSDLEQALSAIGSYTGRALHVESVKAGVRVRRGADLAFMRELELPARVRPGARVRARITVQRLRGRRETITVALRMPRDLEPGSRQIILEGADADSLGDELLDALTLELGDGGKRSPSRDGSALDEGPQSLPELVEFVEELERYDGVRLYVDRARGDGAEAYRDPRVRLSGRVSTRVRVARG